MIEDVDETINDVLSQDTIGAVENIVVCKFGGSSVANAEQISKVENIINSDEKRRFVVVSAPGKDSRFRHKVTDLLYNLYFSVNKFEKNEFPNYEIISGSAIDFQEMLLQRYSSLSADLGLSGKIIEELKKEMSVKKVAESSSSRVASLGEHFSARMISEYLGASFVDASDIIKLRKDGSVIMNATMDNISKLRRIKGKVVIPGFYGALLSSDDVMTFSRGGSDFTGSLIAAGINAVLYENWTDRDGISACDPRLFEKGELSNEFFIIPKMSYRETRELTYMGFEVFNDESIGPLVQKNIPLVIKNTNNPSAPGTLISREYDSSMPVRGIAGRNGFCSINVEKYLMNKTVGFGASLLNILSEYGINYEHSPSGIDSMSVVLEQKMFDRYKRDIMGDITKTLSPDSITVKEHLGLVAVVGEGMKNNGFITSRIMHSLATQNIETEIISQGASENNIILGINANDYARAIKTLYFELIKR